MKSSDPFYEPKAIPCQGEDTGPNGPSTRETKIVWFNAIGFVLLLSLGGIGCLVAIFGYCSWKTTVWSLFLAYGAGVGVTMGAHRLWAHRAFKAKQSLKIFLLLLHTIAGQNCLWVWVRDHRQHHKFSDTHADPHNANNGFFFSHIGWLMFRKHSKVLEYGKKVDMSDLEADKWIMFQKDHYKVLYTIFALAIPVLLPVYVWHENFWISAMVAFFGRTFVNLNVTWSVNSVAHLYGTRPYNKFILPVESALVSLLTVGEGWHNYHHQFPFDYKASEFGMPYNFTRTMIEFFARHGLIYDLKFATPEMVAARIAKTGDGTHGDTSLKTSCKTIVDAVVPDENRNTSSTSSLEMQSSSLARARAEFYSQ